MTEQPPQPLQRPDPLPAWVQEVIEERLAQERTLWLEESVQQQPHNRQNIHSDNTNHNYYHQPPPPLQSSSSSSLHERIGNYVKAMATTPKTSLTHLLDLGVPLDPPRAGSQDVLLLYSNERSIPLAVREHQQAHPNQEIVQIPSAEEAVANCDYVHVIFTDHSPQRAQCIAIVPQYESFYIQRYGRYNPQTHTVVSASSSDNNSNYPFQLVPYSTKLKGLTEFRTPSLRATQQMWDMLRTYLQHVDTVQQELRTLLQQSMDTTKNPTHTIIVMVCNFGQSELLLNFVCAARARGLDKVVQSHVLVFATDEETYTLAQGLGLTSYYDARVSSSCFVGGVCFFGGGFCVCTIPRSSLSYTYLFGLSTNRISVTFPKRPRVPTVMHGTFVYGGYLLYNCSAIVPYMTPTCVCFFFVVLVTQIHGHDVSQGDFRSTGFASGVQCIIPRCRCSLVSKSTGILYWFE
jgi:hypothetical protein